MIWTVAMSIGGATRTQDCFGLVLLSSLIPIQLKTFAKKDLTGVETANGRVTPERWKTVIFGR